MIVTLEPRWYRINQQVHSIAKLMKKIVYTIDTARDYDEQCGPNRNYRNLHFKCETKSIPKNDLHEQHILFAKLTALGSHIESLNADRNGFVMNIQSEPFKEFARSLTNLKELSFDKACKHSCNLGVS
jgi:hypothetical protein